MFSFIQQQCHERPFYTCNANKSRRLQLFLLLAHFFVFIAVLFTVAAAEAARDDVLVSATQKLAERSNENMKRTRNRLQFEIAILCDQFTS